MKQLLFTLLVVCPTLLFAQQEETNFELPLFKMELPINENTGQISFTYVVQVNDVLKDELFSRAMAWFGTKYNEVEEVIKMEDKENGVIIGMAFTDMTIMEAGLGEIEKMYYTIKVYLRDGRYKFVATDLRFQSYPSEYDLYPDIFSAENLLIENFYKKNGKVRTKNLDYKEKTITAIRSLALDMQQAMYKEKFTADGDQW